MWSAVRWSTYSLISTQVGTKELNSHGIYGPSDLLPLPWDKTESDINMPSDDEVQSLRDEIRAINAANG